MHSAVEARERDNAIEWLARAGPELARHLDPLSLLDEAVTILQRLTGAATAWIVTIADDIAQLRAHVGLARSDVGSWPRPVADLPPAGLSVPVKREGETVALLCATGRYTQYFGKTAVEVTTILANYLAVALSNTELYRALAQSEAELRWRATHDPLTGLANRALAAQRIEEALTLAPSGGVGLMFCDLDKFKEVNDRLGHEAGDELIQQVAQRLEECTRPTDLLARFGGDEFVFVISSALDLSDLTDVGRRVQTALADPFLLRGERVQVSASIGGVLGTRGQYSATEMLRDADAAMYAAKVKGPGRVEVFDEAASHRSMDRLDLRSELPRALDNGQLSVHYQPIVDMPTGTIAAFEALLRWNHPQRGAIPPDVFIPIAEETGALVPIGAWVLEQACRQLARWRRLPQGRALRISVNVSATQLAQPDLAKVALDAISRAGISPDNLWLEVTEHERVGDDLTAPVAALRDAGAHFSLDDFGMSYSNLSYLQRFPIEGIKVDRSFVAGIAEREADRGIVRAILAIADSLGLVVIAEGVETVEQRDTLIELGCPLGQGYLMSRPLSAAGATALLMTPPSTVDR
jgi:diguanylate cyclase (GGDEF)-like protein